MLYRFELTKSKVSWKLKGKTNKLFRVPKGIFESSNKAIINCFRNTLQSFKSTSLYRAMSASSKDLSIQELVKFVNRLDEYYLMIPVS